MSAGTLRTGALKSKKLTAHEPMNDRLAQTRAGMIGCLAYLYSQKKSAGQQRAPMTRQGAMMLASSQVIVVCEVRLSGYCAHLVGTSERDGLEDERETGE